MVGALIPRRMRVNRIIKPLVVVLAAIWFLADAIFSTIAHPLARWLGEHWVLFRLRTWIRSLRPYPALALFAVPLIILEPVKPVAAYLTATGHITAGLALLLAGEMLKIVLIERLFCISRDKLMSIAAFAWCYDRLLQAREWMESLKAWQLTRRLSFVARRAVHRYVLELKEPEKQQRPSWQSR